ncbi:hypothetical protein QR680_008644 [Steinernema hermaphroditum]|uniref:Decapping nuclease n=1 Tax=Steinernema hermaphroditum TaxID=289476 RepID=A0AA39IHC2_9BILA|nr:hypothetical protein QR680_008644 [Steinernema hermaphroditum]
MISSQKLAQIQGILLEKQEIVRKNEERINRLIDEIAHLRNRGASNVDVSSSEEEIIEAEEVEEKTVKFSKHPTKVGEFALRDTSTLLPVNTVKAFLRKEIFDLPPGVNQPGLPLDLLDGVDSFFCTEHKNERFPAFLSWIQQAALPEQSLQEFLLGAEFVSLRGTLHRLPKGRAVVCCKFEGVIFLCETEWKNLDYEKDYIYRQISLRDYVSEKRLAKEATDKTDEFYMVYACGEKTESSARFCYATKTDCVDEDGFPVQVPNFYGRTSRQITVDVPTIIYLEQRRAEVIARTSATSTNVGELQKVMLRKIPSTPESDERNYADLARLQEVLVAIRSHFRSVEEGVYVTVKKEKHSLRFIPTEQLFMPRSFQRRFKQGRGSQNV